MAAFKSKYKIAFFDIDGTLVSLKTHRVPESTLRALNAMREQGMKLVISTGRSLPLLQDFLRTGFDAYITLNGQYCFDEQGAYRDVPLDVDDIKVVAKRVEAGEFDALVMESDRTYVNRLTERNTTAAANVDLVYEEGDFSRVYDHPVYQFNFFIDRADEPAALEGTKNMVATRWCDLFCDIVPAEGGKDFGVAATLARYGLTPEEAVAFGDGENDLSMLKAVGLGIAMGNAGELVKEKADYVTSHIDEDGIYNACKHFGII